MQHSHQIEGFGTRLRPVRMEDAAFIVWLRNLDHAKGRVGDSAQDVSAQEKWFEKYFQREGDYYFIIETQNGTAVGAYGIYDVVNGTSAESGRWIIRAEVPAALPSAVLAFELAFGKLGLTELRAKTVTSNKKVLSLNKKFGFQEMGLEKDSQMIGGVAIDQMRFLLKKEDWAVAKPKLLPLAKIAEAQILEWEKSEKKA
jgi:RimJ/RimL family protein N-acetyltransferase